MNDYASFWEHADRNCRTVVGDLEHRIYVKFLTVKTASLVRKMEAAPDDANLDDETSELTARLQAIGCDWFWYDFAGLPAPHRIIPKKADLTLY